MFKVMSYMKGGMRIAFIFCILLAVDAFYHTNNVRRSNIGVKSLKSVDIHSVTDSIKSLNHFDTSTFYTAAEQVSRYATVDKSGFIGGIATGIEIAIDAGHSLLNKVGVQYSYGFSIALFTLLIKAATLPLTITQLESTTKMQKLTPLQTKITNAFPNPEDEQTKNQLMAQLFQAANVNPLAGCFPALVQIPIFISLYRALQNLVAENKLDEPFLWIPDLEGPTYSSPPGESLNWVKSIISGTPDLGWESTLAFLTLPVILLISQTASQKILQPPKDPNKVYTDQELATQGLVNNLPFIVAFFSLNVPSGLAIYWIINNIATTLITVAVKSNIKDEDMPSEVNEIMAIVERGGSAAVMGGGNAPRGPSMAQQEFRGGGSSIVDDRPNKSGFADVVDVDYKDAPIGNDDSDHASASDVNTADAISTSTSVSDKNEMNATPPSSVTTPASNSASVSSETKPKRKKRTKPSKKKKGKQ